MAEIQQKKNEMDIRFLVIEGNIGAGKTTLATRFSDEFNAKLVLEQFADNPFLPKFYEDKERYSFPLELSFLADRYNQIKKEVLHPELFRNMLIADYYFTKSAIFAGNTLQKDEYRLFRRLFNIVFESLPKPDLYVYLHLSVENLMKNIRKRGRDYEQKMDPGYLEQIQQGYFEYFRQITQFPILIVDTNGIDFVGNEDHYKLLKDLIFNNEFKLGVNRIIL
ncbi:MAG: deoxynucleoside kinase [Bacteroidota bacterium]